MNIQDPHHHPATALRVIAAIEVTDLGRIKITGHEYLGDIFDPGTQWSSCNPLMPNELVSPDLSRKIKQKIKDGYEVISSEILQRIGLVAHGKRSLSNNALNYLASFRGKK